MLAVSFLMVLRLSSIFDRLTQETVLAKQQTET